jgi:hypothetical protein
MEMEKEREGGMGAEKWAPHIRGWRWLGKKVDPTCQSHVNVGHEGRLKQTIKIWTSCELIIRFGKKLYNTLHKDLHSNIYYYLYILSCTIYVKLAYYCWYILSCTTYVELTWTWWDFDFNLELLSYFQAFGFQLENGNPIEITPIPSSSHKKCKFIFWKTSQRMQS